MPPSDCAVCSLPAAPTTNPDKQGDPAPYEVRVHAVSHGLRSEFQAGDHTLELDAGRALGGAQSAPSPVEGFLSSIVACSQITLHIVAKERGVDLPDITWNGWGVFDTRRLVANAETNPKFQRITVHGTLASAGEGISQATLDDLAAATSSRCPISKSLHPDIDYQLTLAAKA